MLSDKTLAAMGGVPTFLAEGVPPAPEGATRFVHNGFVFPGHVVASCGHKLAESEWLAGYRTCERCPA